MNFNPELVVGSLALFPPTYCGQHFNLDARILPEYDIAFLRGYL